MTRESESEGTAVRAKAPAATVSVAIVTILATGLAVAGLAAGLVAAGCGGHSSTGGAGQPGASVGTPGAGLSSDPAEVLRSYLTAVGKGDFETAKTLLDNPSAVAWPGAGGTNPPKDAFSLRDIQVEERFVESPNEVGYLARAYLKPGPKAQEFGTGKEGQWRFAFYLVKSGDAWKVWWGGPVSEDRASYLATRPVPFQNVTCDLTTQCKAGQEYRLSFDYAPPPLSAWVENFSVLFQSTPDVSNYPYSYECIWSVWQPGSGGTREVGKHFDLTTTVDEEAKPGHYRIYLCLGEDPTSVMRQPLPPYVVEVVGGG